MLRKVEMGDICPYCGGVVEASRITETEFQGLHCIDCGRKFRMKRNKKKKNDENIYIVPEKSEMDKFAFDWFGWTKFIKGKRAIPHHSKLKGFTAVLGKVRGTDAIVVMFSVDTGITLRYKGKEWRETEQFEVEVPFKKAAEIREGISKILKRYGVRKKVEMEDREVRP